MVAYDINTFDAEQAMLDEHMRRLRQFLTQLQTTLEARSEDAESFTEFLAEGEK